MRKAYAAAMADWREERMSEVRKLIEEAVPDVVEESKWVKASNPNGIPVWHHEGIICTGETYKDKIKLTFLKGASVDDPKGLFNSSLEGNTRRAIDIYEDDELDRDAFKDLIRAAAVHNAG
jgi:hypothetical protein